MRSSIDTDDVRNLAIVCLAKTVRTVGFGAISVVLALFLLQRGFTTVEVGALFSLTLLEDALVTSFATLAANRVGMRNVLLLSCAIILIGGCTLAFAEAKWLIAVAVVCGIVSPAGYEGGPFAAIEQSIVSQSVKTDKLTRAFSWYNLSGFAGAALGALLAGFCVSTMCAFPVLQAYQVIFLLYAFSGILLAALYASVYIVATAKPTDQVVKNSPATRGFLSEAANAKSGGDAGSNKYILQLACLQSVDAFGGGFVVQALLTCWFYQRYHVDATFLGPVFFGCNVIAALSFFAAPWVVKRIGLLNAMVFTHLPCSLGLCLLPFLPTAGAAAALLLLRSAFSSMDIPARQAYTMLIVSEANRPKAAGITTSARAVAQSLAPCLTGFLTSNAATGLPLILAGAFKSVYDISLYYCFKKVPMFEDRRAEIRAEGRETASAR
jgi:MFS family permease